MNSSSTVVPTTNEVAHTNRATNPGAKSSQGKKRPSFSTSTSIYLLSIFYVLHPETVVKGNKEMYKMFLQRYKKEKKN